MVQNAPLKYMTYLFTYFFAQNSRLRPNYAYSDSYGKLLLFYLYVTFLFSVVIVMRSLIQSYFHLSGPISSSSASFISPNSFYVTIVMVGLSRKYFCSKISVQAATTRIVSFKEIFGDNSDGGFDLKLYSYKSFSLKYTYLNNLFEFVFCAFMLYYIFFSLPE